MVASGKFRLHIPAAQRHAQLPRIAGIAILILASIGASMFTIDAWTIAEVPRLPMVIVSAAYKITDFGKSGWLLFPLLGLLIVCVTTCALARTRFVALVLSAVAARMCFLFVAIGAPGLLTSIVKVVVGRVRPSIGAGNPFIFHPFVFHAQDMSLPSGHSTTAFAAAMAMWAIWPRIGAAVWVYALLIGASRVMVMAHFPSDVMVSAVIGIAGSLLVRRCFAARRLAFSIQADGKIKALPGPSFRRLRKAARSLLTARKQHSARVD